MEETEKINRLDRKSPYERVFWGCRKSRKRNQNYRKEEIILDLMALVAVVVEVLAILDHFL